MLTNSNRTKKRLFLGFAAGFLAINGAQRIYQALLRNRRKRQFLAYLKNDPTVTFGNFHRASVYGYKHIRSSQNVYFAVRQLSDTRYIVRRHAPIWAMPESYAITDFDYNFLSDFAYYVDDQMALQDHFEPICTGDCLDDRFQVIQTIDDIAFPCTRFNGWNTLFNTKNVEIVTHASLKENIISITNALQWNYTIVPDTPGMVTAKIIAMIINEAYYTLGDEVSTKKNIDIAMQLGTNYPYGPFEWAAYIGLEHIYKLLKNLSISDERFVVAKALEVEWLGKLKG